MIVLKLLLPVFAGGLVAGGVTYGVVHTQTSAPDTNPATSSEIISYGDKS